ncbi:MAG: hypothetical protein COW01_12635 [Bdellovibrionales bacterium CG12_big_fil_rev_8_21_14_0_65_38_15]|nr:MAG: hypothetical protein COW79_13950 [Bdellovibrionales bacterium CG22_combo_CG10-13_8_21_14_all_38_13]PIQ53836.1 MAG: hypothetical protein COW01_12635 [Bdellovibrionales bacterium CG12_big_fil_rev_8_21_14_0_65_38_15]PIR30896.1 MAG: hypothetical protein COV38_03260 [Bdellovibrionales bacterium CG11_big_fil_rev_8_21_14_0_20_38_13]
MINKILSLFLMIGLCSGSFANENTCEDDGDIFNPCSIKDTTLRNFISNNFAANTSCIASTAMLESSGVKVPKCGDQEEQLLDNRYPTGGIFFGYYVGMKSGDFIQQLTESASTEGATVNIVVASGELEYFHSMYEKNEKLKNLIDKGGVKIIPVKGVRKGAIKWMQDSMQFTTMDKKVGILQMSQEDEEGRSLDKTIACQIAKACDLPIVQEPISSFDKSVLEDNPQAIGGLRAGGNLEVLPGGVILTGGAYNDDSGVVEFDPMQKEIIESISKKSGQDYVKIDTNFLTVGHADELYNSVKISEEERIRRGLPKECNFLILEASPSKAKEILTRESLSAQEGHSTSDKAPGSGVGSGEMATESASASSAGAAAPIEITKNMDSANQRIYDLLESVQDCKDLTHTKIYDQISRENVPMDSINAKVNEFKCFGLSGFTASEVLLNENLKNQNFGGSELTPFSSRQYMNRERILDKVREASGCQSPPILEVPAMVDGGDFILPDQVNGVTINGKNDGSGSSFLTPSTFYGPFDNYLKDQLDSFGVKTTQVQDIEYHITKGEVHCGSNSALVCKE